MTEDLPTFKLIAAEDQSEFIIDKTIIAGRNDQCDLVIDLGQASRKHAQLTPTPEGVWVEDLNSTNGTYLNDIEITEPVLAVHGDIIRIDAAAFELIDPNYKEASDPADDATIVAADQTQIAPKPVEQAPAAVSEKPEAVEPSATPQIETPAEITPEVSPSTADQSHPQAEESPTTGEAEIPETPAASEPKVEVPDAENPKVQNPGTNVPESKSPVAEHTPVKQESEKSVPNNSVTPEASTPQTNKPTVQKPTIEETHKPESALPPAWAMDGNQSVDGTQFFPINRIAQQAQQRAAENLIQVKEPCLLGKSDNFTTLRYILAGAEQQQWEIGRADSADIIVNDQSVSNSHAQLIKDGERWKLVDLMSANGTYVNGVKGLTTYLQSGNLIRFGQIEFQFLLPPEKKPASEFTATKPSSKNRRRRSNPLLVGACTLSALLVIAAVVYWLG